MDNPTGGARSPLTKAFLAAGSASPDVGVVVRPAPLIGQVAVRGRPEDEAFRAAVRGAAGLDLPLAAGDVVDGPSGCALWLGPDHWLVVTGEGEGPALAARLKEAFAGLFAAAIDVSGARTRLRLAGPAAAEVLASGCRLDLEPAAFGAGQAVQTPVGNVTAIVHCRTAEPPDEGLCYDLYVPRSQALSFWRWLEQAGRPWGLGVPA